MEGGDSPEDSLTCHLTLKYESPESPTWVSKGVQATRTDAYSEGLWLEL